MLRRLFQLAPLLLAAVATTAQDSKKPAVQDPEIEAKAKVLKECVTDRKMARDAEGVEIIDQFLVKLQAGVVDKDEDIITKALGQVLTRGKVRKHDNIGLYVAAATALGYCGKDGAKILKKAYEGKRFKHHSDWVPLREHLLRNIGRTKDESMVDFLVEEAVRSPEDALMAAAGEALGNFENSKEKVRKEIVSELIKRWGSLDSKASEIGSGNIQAANARNTLAVTSGKWNETLAKLTRQNFTKFLDWQSWNNKNRNKPWK